MGSSLDKFPGPHAGLNNPIFRIRGLAWNRQNHFPIDADLGVTTLNRCDRFIELSLGLHGAGSRADSQINVKGAGRRNERWLINPAALYCAYDALWRDQA